MGQLILSTAEARRPIVSEAALRTFAQGGYYGATVADVAREARISSAYVFKLFPSKESLFVAALETCFDHVQVALAQGAEQSGRLEPDELLNAMGLTYAELIRDRDLLMLQVHAQSAADIPDIGAALRAGIARITRFVSERSGADDAAVQRFMAYGQLCHLIVTARIDGIAESWATLLTTGIRHPD